MPDMNNYPAWPGWETVRLIGRGSYGAVYEIERDVLGEPEKAAMKVMTIPQSDNEIDELRGAGYDDESITATFREYLKDIVSEYSLMRKLNGSSNVVNCDDVRIVEHDGGYGWDIFIKMELLTPLVKALGRDASEEQVIRIGSDLCKALILCRKHSIVHRDIKPANIFVSSVGDYKLGDFGVARTMERTTGGTKIGTYEYMAPEVYNNQPYGAAADIYSLGMVLYWLLNNWRGPFLPPPPALLTTAGKESARKRRFAGEPLPAPANGSEGLRKIVMKACAFDPKGRYHTAEDMLADLEELSTAHRENPTEPVTPKPAPSPKDDDITVISQKAPEPIKSVSEPVKPAPEPANPTSEPAKPTAAPAKPAPVRKKSWLWIAALAAAAVLGLVFFLGDGKDKAPAPASATDAPTATPTIEHTIAPTDIPTSAPTLTPTPSPAPTPTSEPTVIATGKCGNKCMWSLRTDDVLTIEGSGQMADYTHYSYVPWCESRRKIKSVVIKNGVTSIGKHAFNDCTGLISISIPDSVTNIGSFAFDNCTSLTSITISNGMKSIGQYAFSQCTNLTSITIPNGVTSIGNSVFASCSSLTGITIPDGVTSIGSYAFDSCISLTSISIPNSVKSIGEYAFNRCTGLTSISIPKSVKSISNGVFGACYNLTSVSIPDSVTSIGDGSFGACNSLTSITIPDSVTSIGNSAFARCSSLTGISIPKSVKSIGNSTFAACTSLTSISIPGNVSSIGNYTFTGCTSLTSITIPNSVKSIGQYAFLRCTNLTSISIPKSIKTICELAFGSCTSLKDVYYTGSKAQWKAIKISNGNDPLTSATIHYNS